MGFSVISQYAVFIFGFFQEVGLATNFQQPGFSEEGLLATLVAFNIGEELRQLNSLLFMVTLMHSRRYSSTFQAQPLIANSILMRLGLFSTLYQLIIYVVEG